MKSAAQSVLYLLLVSVVIATELSDPPVIGSQRWVSPSPDRTHFVVGDEGERYVIWGANYDHDDDGRLLEDYWGDEWEKVEEDFREMEELGVNTVRIHLQLNRFMIGREETNDANLSRLRKLINLAGECGVYLNLTGLGCYHKESVPEWYDTLTEADRWEVQARFWMAIASVGKDRPEVICYNLMNEPLVSGGDDKENWLPGEPLGGKHYVQRITTNAAGRSDREIARQWVAKLSSAIRSVDDRHMITVGVIPWAQTFPGASPLFYTPDVSGPLDFASVHFYPRTDRLVEDLAALKKYEVGKPLVIEEIFPLSASISDTQKFIARSEVDGWISFYWGKTIAEYRAEGSVKGALVGGWLEEFSKKQPPGRQR